MHASFKAILAAALAFPLIVNAQQAKQEPAKEPAKTEQKPADAKAGSGAGVQVPALPSVTFFGSARVLPTYYGNFDFNQQLPDVATLNEGGFASGEHVRAELRLGARTGGDNWKFMMILEGDMILEKDTADRSFYGPATNPAGTGTSPNAGAEFGIERAEFNYTFAPTLELATGWNIRAADIRSGGMVFGDDHPFIGFRGKLNPLHSYEILYIPIQNRDRAGVRDLPRLGDWRVYMLKTDHKVSTFTLSPFVIASDNVARDTFNATTNVITTNPGGDARVYYGGFEAFGQVGMFKPVLEVVGVTGKFRNGIDVRSFAAYGGTEVVLHKAFNPYVAVRYTKGDDNRNDRKAEGFVGITDIGRFTPLMGMDGNILSEHLASGANIYNSPLYSYSPDRAVGGNLYGGISGASSGNNPGQQLLAVGTKGALDMVKKGLTYKAQAFFIRYDKTENLQNVKTPGQKVDKYVGTTADLQLAYAFSKNFSASYIASGFLPGSGIEDQINADDLASLHSLQFAWAF